MPEPVAPALETEHVPDFVVHESKLSAFVTEHYGRPWRMQQGEELAQGSYRQIEVDGDPEGIDGWWGIDPGPADLLDAWRCEPPPAPGDWRAAMTWERERYLPVEIILWDLCRKGVIQAGEYLIKIWW